MAGNLFFARQMKEENEKNKEKEEKIVMISPYEISPNPSQPRKYFTDEAIFRLADSIRNHGLIQPLTVRKTEEGYELFNYGGKTGNESEKTESLYEMMKEDGRVPLVVHCIRKERK